MVELVKVLVDLWDMQQLTLNHADYVIAITDNLVPFPNSPASIDQTLVDAVVVVDEIGDPKKQFQEP